ncbi:hypothetical protein, partial [Thiolapillus sp.]
MSAGYAGKFFTAGNAAGAPPAPAGNDAPPEKDKADKGGVLGGIAKKAISAAKSNAHSRNAIRRRLNTLMQVEAPLRA